MKSLFFITTIAAINISGCTMESLQEPNPTKTVPVGALDIYNLEHKVTLYSKVEFGRGAAIAFNDFRKSDKGYFGAFAYSSGSRDYSYGEATGHNTLKTAREYALDNCAVHLKGGPACKVIAVLTPMGFVDRHKMTLSKNITKDLHNLRNARKYIAIATNDAGYADWVAGYDTQESANSEALRLCDLRVKTQTPRHQKAYPCYLIPKQQ